MNVTTKKPLRNELADLQHRQKLLFAMNVETMTWDEYRQHQRERSYLAHAIACAKQRITPRPMAVGLHEAFTPKQTQGNAAY